MTRTAKTVAAAPERKGWLSRTLAEPDPGQGTDPRAYDAEAVARTLRWLGLLFGDRRWFRLDVRGWDRVPPAPALVVSNHSGGTTILDAWGLFVSWYRHFGTGRPLHPMAHEILLAPGRIGRFFARRGVLQANPATALAALRHHREDLLVMPGGDLDAWRPWRDRYRVRFAGRSGYARLALEAEAPIVPVAHAGAHHTLLVLSDGHRLARAIGLPRIARASIWPVHLALPWGLAVGPLPHLPLPVKLRYRIGEPIEPPRRRRRRRPTENEVAALDEAVRAEIQRLLHALAGEGASTESSPVRSGSLPAMTDPR